MSIKDTVYQRMILAMKAKDKPTKEAYKYLFDQLQKEEKSKQSATNPNPVLTEADELTVVKRVVKQAKDAMNKTVAEAVKKGIDPNTLNDFVEQKKFELKVYSEFMPAEMTAEEIQTVIDEVVASLPTPINKGLLMKNLMPKVKGHADNKLVATLVDEYLKM